MSRDPEQFRDVLPGVIAELAERHGVTNVVPTQRPSVRHATGSRTPRPTPAGKCVCRPDHVPLVERQIIALLAEAVTVEAIAAEVGYSVGTVKTYVARARRRLGARTSTHLVTLAFQRRLIGFDRAGRVVVAATP